MVSLLYQQREGKSLTAIEWQQLDAWMTDPGNAGLIDLLDDRQRLVEELKALEDYDSDAAVRNIFEQLELPLPETGKDKKDKSPIPLIRRIAVAAVFLVIATAVWLMVRRPAAAPVAVQPLQKQMDITPGGNKAILTLGNGARIVLDSSAAGTIAHQGSIAVVKLSDGQVAYQPTANLPTDSVVYNTLSTPRGGVYQLTLPDGSKAWLNAASSITYPTAFTGNQRLIRITGEVYFEVAHRPNQPFKVQAGDQLIEDMATAFDIDAYSDEPAVVTTLTEGKARVAAGGMSHILAPGQQAQSHNGGLTLSADVDIAQVLAWKNGSFSFRHADLPTVMRQLSRWYAIDVVYEGSIPSGTFDGEIGRGLTLNQVLQGLAQTRIHYVIESSHKIIIRP